MIVVLSSSVKAALSPALASELVLEQATMVHFKLSFETLQSRVLRTLILASKSLDPKHSIPGFLLSLHPSSSVRLAVFGYHICRITWMRVSTQEQPHYSHSLVHPNILHDISPWPCKMASFTNKAFPSCMSHGSEWLDTDATKTIRTSTAVGFDLH